MTCWMRGGLGIVPAHNLIQNVGFRADAAHTTYDYFGRHQEAAQPMLWPLKHPAAVVPNDDFDRKSWLLIYRPFTFVQRVRRKLILARKALFGARHPEIIRAVPDSQGS